MLTSWIVDAIVTLLILAVVWGCGYMTAKHKADIQQARVQTVTQIVTKTVTVTDKTAADALALKLAASEATEHSLLDKLKEARRASPVIADCRLPVGLRDSINAGIATANAP